MFQNNLKSLVKKNSLLWGKEVAEDYHKAAERDMEMHWNGYVEPALARHAIDYSEVVDFACGYGRNTDFLLRRAGRVSMVDVNKHNIEYCRAKYQNNQRVEVRACNGYDLGDIGEASCTFFYTFDSMVHFPLRIVEAYLPEFFRVLKPGGYALVHHSNYTKAGPNADFKKNPHWRNYMSAEIFAGLAKAAGFVVAEQTVHPWGVPNLDCVTILLKPHLETAAN
ncbi:MULTISPECIES: class I SAM-dependent methyltransferase [unclassified Ensifer]|uniref:class I SAM-dependent methyltransferase n=1 Tax=unclassified Ensifer TaxID=2633371 RepID=UPI00300FC2F1